MKNKKRQKNGLIVATIVVGFLALNAVYLYIVSARTGYVNKHFVYQYTIVVLAIGGCMLLRKKVGYILLGAVILSSITAPTWFMPKIAYSKRTYPPNFYRRSSAITFLEKHYGKNRVLIEDKALPVNIGDVYNIQTFNGYGATLHEHFYKYINEPDASDKIGQHLDLLNVKFLATIKENPDLNLVLYDPDRNIYIYERDSYVPRAYFADELQTCLDKSPGCTDIKISDYKDTYIKMKYNSDSPESRQLVLSEVNYQGWQAFVDGKKVEISTYSPTNVKLFRSIMVPPGSHQVEFRYNPLGI